MSTTDAPSLLSKRFGYALKRCQHVLRLRMDEVLRPLSLTTPQYAVLSAIEAEPGISNARLARTAFVTPQTMQGILANLERNGIITRLPDPLHGRILRSELTVLGQETLLNAHRAVSRVEEMMFTSIGAENVASLTEILSNCADDLSD
ncbi:MarR family winged helix-turn-helix transcriptional regulator [Serratia sp. M24T3]|uniref:MarR family winged helix-turn-helix transcriptional regulator n=1 Tax=Serratia sp. M24T3 TaxID=932213 RepID=UPI00025B9B76|nr:MarR family winged helix-turn-helix transcriptional regulator [Serratia sp. M24T3]EIC85955.1 MarR family transcriptional regulator [Serratia sp. M24T3]